MSLRRKRFLLWLASGVFAGLAAATCVWAFLPLSDLNQSPSEKHNQSLSGHDGTGASVPPYSNFARLMELDLRRPIEDSGAAKVATYAYKLTGTIMEPGNNIAMLQGPDGNVELKAVGQKAGDAEVLEIQEKQVVVFYGGQKLTLKIEGNHE